MAGIPKRRQVNLRSTAKRLPLRVALTGGIATGKSYVLACFADAGIPTVDADELARRAVRPGGSGALAIRARFGPDVVRPNGTINRARLARRVFQDPAERRALEAIVHPLVRGALETFFAALAPANGPFAVAAIPLLFETGQPETFDRVVVTACPRAVQLERLRRRDGLTEGEMQQRLDAQLPTDEKIRRADYVVWTDRSHSEVDAQVTAVVAALRGAAGRQARA